MITGFVKGEQGDLGFIVQQVSEILIMKEVAAPAAPTSGFLVYVDIADHKLKAIGPGGTVTILALP